MRRSDREITDPAQIEAFIAKEQILRVAFYDAGDIYIVPVNYGYRIENGRYSFYFHGAKAGRKYTLSLQKPSVGFEIDGQYALVSAEAACGHSANFMSVIGNGMLQIVSDADEIKNGLQCIMQQATGRADWTFHEAALAKTAVFRLNAETMSCKAKG